MIVLDYFGQQLEWVWAIVFVHGPYGTEESFINFEPNYNNCNQRLVNNESNICDTKLFGAKLSVLNKWCQIVWCKNVWCQIILTSHYLVPNCPSANLSWCQNFPDTKLSWPQIFLVLICLQSNRAGAKLSWCLIVLKPNFLVPYCLILNCWGVKLSWCQIALVPNCPGTKLSGVKLSWCQIVWCQIVLVPNCPGAKLSWS